MPWKLLALIILMAFVLVFVGFNLDNRSDISLVFYTFTNVPVVITLLVSFICGLVVAFAFTVSKALKPTSARAAARNRSKSGRSPAAGSLNRGINGYPEELEPPAGAMQPPSAPDTTISQPKKRTQSKRGRPHVDHNPD